MQAIFLAKDNDFCGVGTYLDTDYGDCLPCMDIKCAKCNEIGCISCLNGNIPSEDGCWFDTRSAFDKIVMLASLIYIKVCSKDEFVETEVLSFEDVFVLFLAVGW